jgi:molecular chaperone HscB
MSATEKNFFQLLSVPQSFEVDMNLLTDNYRQLQRATHPDRFANASERERLLSVQQAAQINDAFNTLKKPLSRARYLLGLAGVSTDEENNTAMDPMFLMQQMELREAMAEVQDLDALGALLDDIDAQRRNLMQALKDSLSSDENDALQQAAQLVQKLQFFDKLQEEAEHLEAKLDV